MSESSSDEEFVFEGDAPKKEQQPVLMLKPPPTAKKKESMKKKEKAAKDDEEEESTEDEPIAAMVSTKKKRASATAARAKLTTAVQDNDDFIDDDNDDEEAASPPKKKKKVEKKVKTEKKGKTAEKTDKKRKKPSSATKPSGSGSSTKKVKKEASAATTNNTTNSSKAKTQRELKKLDKTERLQYAMQSFLWWNAPELRAGCQWITMEHAGVSFPDPYQPHGVPLLYAGTPVRLSAVQEEAATFFAATDPDGMHLGNPATRTTFIQNFFADFRAVLGKKHVVQDFDQCDFELIRRHLSEQKMIRQAVTDAERQAAKDDRNTVLHHYGYALVDGHLERVGNYNMEPPGAFRGRGAHPKMGKLKGRVRPEQVSLNLSEGAPVPKCPVPGHAWSDVRHDPRGQWLATWKENINHQSKYMQLAAQSSFKGKSDRSKYNKAALLCKNIAKIRNSYKKDLKSKDTETKQLATAVWLIDRLALRVGGEKDTEEEADTVGCCSLRVEHLHIDPNEEGGDNKEIELEFLGKDSMLFKSTIDYGAPMYNDNNGMGTQVYENLKAFCKHKKKSDQVFKDLNPTILNNHLKQFMDGLSAKVFRTYNASKTLQDELQKHETSARWKSLSASDKVTEYNSANREVAILCNHQRSVSKAQETQLENIGTKLTTLKKQKKQLKGMLKKLSAGETDGIPTRKPFEVMQVEVDKALAKAKKMKESAKTNEEKIAATEADEKAKLKKRSLADAKFDKAHLWEKVPSQEQVSKKIEAWTKKIEKMEMDLKHKDDNKEVSLGTSKINYMDPRISVAWCKRNDVPIEKVFSKTLRDKFNWAMAVTPDWEFNETVAEEG